MVTKICFFELRHSVRMKLRYFSSGRPSVAMRSLYAVTACLFSVFQLGPHRSDAPLNASASAFLESLWLVSQTASIEGAGGVRSVARLEGISELKSRCGACRVGIHCSVSMPDRCCARRVCSREKLNQAQGTHGREVNQY